MTPHAHSKKACIRDSSFGLILKRFEGMLRVIVVIIALVGYTFHVAQLTGRIALMSPLQWIHLLILRLTLDQGGSMPFSIYVKSPATTLVEDFLAANEVPTSYGKPLTHAQTIKRMLVTLTGLGLVTEEGGVITLTEQGRNLIESVGDNWRNWPRVLPLLEDGAPDFDNADYV